MSPTTGFALHPQLAQGTRLLGHFELCQVRFLPDPQVPWIVLVPARNGLKEIHQLSLVEAGLLMQEACLVSKILEQEFHPDKVNLGALGNLVPQLHVHLMARFATDRAWPGPLWGTQAPQGTPDQSPAFQTRLEQALSPHFL